MRNAMIFAALCVFALAACCSQVPECPPCEECPTCGVGSHLECVPDAPPPPPPEEPQPEDYKRIEVTVAEADWLESNDGLADHIWSCVRHPEYVLGHCPDCVKPILGISADDLLTLIRMSGDTHQMIYDDQWLVRLRDVNRRCLDKNDALDPWCKRSNIRKTVWSEQYMPLKSVMLAQMNYAAALVARASDYHARAWDGLKQWCQFIETEGILCR